MLINITEYFIEAGREWHVGQNPDVPREVAARWIADGKATADTDGVREAQSSVSGGGISDAQALAGTDLGDSAGVVRLLSDGANAGARLRWYQPAGYSAPVWCWDMYPQSVYEG